ncbi:MAG: hypothetical protein J6386_17730 [Candidatus Synoicihabitans palmerolidicus]|nr:hypothetical protein [Candidatus Synoicihabitans palmerolidicus]
MVVDGGNFAIEGTLGVELVLTAGEVQTEALSLSKGFVYEGGSISLRCYAQPH